MRAGSRGVGDTGDSGTSYMVSLKLPAHNLFCYFYRLKQGLLAHDFSSLTGLAKNRPLMTCFVTLAGIIKGCLLMILVVFTGPSTANAPQRFLPTSVDWKTFPAHSDEAHTAYMDIPSSYRVPKWSFLTNKVHDDKIYINLKLNNQETELFSK